MRNISIRMKLFILLALPLVLLLMSSLVIQVVAINDIDRKYNTLSDEELPRAQALFNLRYSGTLLVSATDAYSVDRVLGIITGTESPTDEELLANIEAAKDALRQWRAVYGTRAIAEDQATVDALFFLTDQMLAKSDEIILLVDNAEVDIITLGQERVAFSATESKFLDLVDSAIETEETRVSDNETLVRSAVRVATLLGVIVPLLTLIVATLGGWLLIRSIVRPLKQLTATTESIAEGNLNLRAEIHANDEIGKLADTFNYMADVVTIREIELREYNTALEQRVKERTAELKDARDKALAAQRLAQENSRLKSEFLSTMSHELRTPLNAIEGFTSIMLSGMGVELSSRAEDMTKRIASNSKRLLNLINDFLDLSRIEAGRLELVESVLSPATLAEKWKRDMSILADEKGLNFALTVDSALPPTILGDEDALSKVAINLLGNAFKFTKEGSVTLGLQKMEEGWAIVVADTGIGIPVHARDYIFEEFRQVDGTSKREFGGTGLGLSLVQKLARAMGGRVMVDSEVGQGSTFTVILPLRTPVEDLVGATNE